MPPRLDQPWDFGPWDNSKRSTPPWQHRGFWYHDLSSGHSDGTLVIVWRYALDDDAGYEVLTGDIYRCTDEEAAAKLFRHHLFQIVSEEDCCPDDGVLIFHGVSHIDHRDRFGRLPPELQRLPDGRWL